MFKRGEIVIPFFIVVAFDIVVWELRDKALGGISLSLLPAAALVVCLLLLLLSNALSRRPSSIPELPDNVQFKGDPGSSEMLYGVLKQMEIRIGRMENAVLTTKQDVKDTQTYLAALDVSVRERERVAHLEARNLAIITTMIGIVAGWLPLLLTKIT